MKIKLGMPFLLMAVMMSACSHKADLIPSGNAVPIEIKWIPEMDYRPETSNWQPIGAGHSANEIKAAQQQWRSNVLWVQTQISNKTVYDLSRWSSDEMKGYTKQPVLSGVTLYPLLKDNSKIILKGIIDTLPSHSRSVARWLVMFVVYDSNKSAITQVIFTIEGERQE